MKTEKKLLIIVPGIFLIAFLLGAIGILRLPPESWAKQPEPESRLIGVLITFRPLHDYDYSEKIADYVREKTGSEKESLSDRIDERVFATLTDKDVSGYESGYDGRKYVFEGVDGIPFFLPQIYDEEKGYSYSYMTYTDTVRADLVHCHSDNDDTLSIHLEGTLALTDVHFMKEGGSPDNCILYFNPVYQDSDGAVYALPGQAMALSEYSDTTSYAMDESRTESQFFSNSSGDYRSSETSQGGSVKINVKRMNPTAEIIAAQYDGNMNLIKKNVYTPDTIPDEYAVSPDAAFLVVETSAADADGRYKTVQKTLLNRGDSSASCIVYYVDRGDGVLVLKGSDLKW
ncbi:MAG: hypothetical protein J5643_09180 [Lachnospiraceae bacterium]|nr:hypothetical protein [Lachnospiraceae bacterium]